MRDIPARVLKDLEFSPSFISAVISSDLSGDVLSCLALLLIGVLGPCLGWVRLRVLSQETGRLIT